MPVTPTPRAILASTSPKVPAVATTPSAIPGTVANPDTQPARQPQETTLANILGARRTARVFMGGKVTTGPLAYKSPYPPAPLTRAEQGALLYAASGLTGAAFGDLDYAFGENGKGNVMMSFIGSTVPTADAGQFVSYIVMDDTGTYIVRPLQGYTPQEKAELLRAGSEQRWEDLWNKMTVKIADQRVMLPSLEYTQLRFNHNVNGPGTTYFLPIADLSSLWLVACFELFDEGHRALIVDSNKFLSTPAKLKKFVALPEKGWRARLGRFIDKLKGVSPDQRYLEKNPNKTYPSANVVDQLMQVIGVEMGARIQNIQLMSTALGLGSRPHYAGNPLVWGAILGFEQQMVPTSTKVGADPFMRFLLKLTKKDTPLPSNVGYKKDGKWVLKSYSPEVHGSVRAAVTAFVNDRFGNGGAFDPDSGEDSAYKNPDEVLKRIPPYTERQIEAVIALNEYLYERYGTYPIGDGFLPVIHTAIEAGVLDSDFYDQHFESGSLTEVQKARSARAKESRL